MARPAAAFKVATLSPRSTRPPCWEPSVNRGRALRSRGSDDAPRTAGLPGLSGRLLRVALPRMRSARTPARLVRARGARPAVATAASHAVGGAGQRGDAAADARCAGAPGLRKVDRALARARRSRGRSRRVRRYASGDGSGTRAGRCGCTRAAVACVEQHGGAVPGTLDAAARAARRRAATQLLPWRLSRSGLASRWSTRTSAGSLRGGCSGCPVALAIPEAHVERAAAGAAPGRRQDVDRPDGAGRAGVRQPWTALRGLPAGGELPLALARRAERPRKPACRAVPPRDTRAPTGRHGAGCSRCCATSRTPAGSRSTGSGRTRHSGSGRSPACSTTVWWCWLTPATPSRPSRRAARPIPSGCELGDCGQRRSSSAAYSVRPGAEGHGDDRAGLGRQLLEHHEHGRRRAVAVGVEDRVRGRHRIRRQVELLLDDLENAPPARVHCPAGDVGRDQAVRCQQPVTDDSSDVAGEHVRHLGGQPHTEAEVGDVPGHVVGGGVVGDGDHVDEV